MPKIKYKDKSFISKILSLKIVVLLSNIIFQGMRYMSIGEKIYKISITIIFAVMINLFIHNILISFILGHLLNYIFNGQFYVVFRYLSSKQTMSREDLNNYIRFIEKMINIFKPLDVLIIGSFCRGRMSKTSDLDIRIYHKSDIVSSIKAYIMATTLRFLGLIYKFPIDVYCFSDLKFLDKINKDEIPVNFLENKEFLNKYPNSINYKEHLTKLELK